MDPDERQSMELLSAKTQDNKCLRVIQLFPQTVGLSSPFIYIFFRRNGALRRPGFTLLYQFLQFLQYQESVRVIQLRGGAVPKPVNKRYARINEQLDELWAEYEVSLYFYSRDCICV